MNTEQKRRGPIYWFAAEATNFYRYDPPFARRMISLIISLCAAAPVLAVLGAWWIQGPVFSKATLWSLRGKTREEVRQILGEPTDIRSQGFHWQYNHPRNSGRVYINFYQNGTVEGVMDDQSLPEIFGSASYSVNPPAPIQDGPSISN